VVINNHSQESLTSPGVTFAIICPIPEGCESDRVPSGQFGSIIEPSAPNGLLLTLPGDGRDIAFTARFGAFPRNILVGGTELPIVRESEFRRAVLRFPYVPFGPGRNPIRSTLRVY